MQAKALHIPMGQSSDHAHLSNERISVHHLHCGQKVRRIVAIMCVCVRVCVCVCFGGGARGCTLSALTCFGLASWACISLALACYLLSVNNDVFFEKKKKVMESLLARLGRRSKGVILPSKYRTDTD